jgi:endonuclease/exonuclease/phosphatase family metal-dependent hydrolase/NAD(P)-dependent dehydrogenase (short-subunit alcohol dehydrogenase family)
MRLATYNVRHGAPSGWFVRKRAMCRSVAALNADVVALQEVDRRVLRSWFADQAAILGRCGDAQAHFAAARSMVPWGRYGNALLVRGETQRIESFPLPGTGEPRVAQFARVVIGGTELTVVGTHLQNRRGSEPSTAPEQLVALLEELSGWPEPWCVMGDLNLRPDVVEPMLADAGLTPVDTGPTYPAFAPRLRIDWIATRGLGPGSAKVPELLTSDHRPVVATFDVNAAVSLTAESDQPIRGPNLPRQRTMTDSMTDSMTDPFTDHFDGPATEFSTSDYSGSPFESPFGEPEQPVFGFMNDLDDDVDDVDDMDEVDEMVTQATARMKDRLAVVTGSTGMLGAAIATELSARGARVCLIGRDMPALLDTERALGPDSRTAVLQCDLSVSEDVVAAVDFVERLDRPVDLLVHAAGLQTAARIADGPVEALDEHYLLNVRGPYLLSQRLLPLLRDGSAQCVFFAAAEAAGSRGGDAHHAITQAAGRALAAELRVEAAPRGVRVVTVVADDEPGRDRGVVDSAAFVSSLAASVVDALSSPDLDVTEVAVRGVARPVRAERR